MDPDKLELDVIPLQWHCVEQHSTEKCSKECLLQSVLEMFSKKHTLTIIRLLLTNERLRFNELEKEIGGSPKTLSQRLKELEKKQLIHRQVFNEIPVRVEYSLTKAGQDLEAVFATISHWVSLWLVQ